MVSIIIYSSDGYSDCWDPFFKLFKENFPFGEDYEIILSTNLKEYSYPGLNINTLANGMDVPWSKRLQISIEKSKNDIIFLIGDDFFLLSKVDKNLFNHQLELILKNKEVDHIRLLHKPGKFKTENSNFKYLDKISSFTRYRFLYAPSLWKKKVLLKYIANNETPFMAEKMGTYRSWILKHGFYCMSNDFVNKYGHFYTCGTSGVIVKGKWAKWAVPVLEAEDLKIDFSIRGIREEDEKKVAMNKARMDQLMNPISTIKSFSSILVLMLKSFFINFK